jgi:hypothetical protein
MKKEMPKVPKLPKMPKIIVLNTLDLGEPYAL